MTEKIDVPQFLPDGSTLMHDHDFITRLHEGDATVGWVGDPRYCVYLCDDRLEIRRLGEDGKLVTIMRSKPGVRLLGTETLRFLADHDSASRRKYDVVEDVIQHNRRLEKANRDKWLSRSEETADRLHFALLKDIGAREGGITKRLHVVARAPWKTDTDK